MAAPGCCSPGTARPPRRGLATAQQLALGTQLGGQRPLYLRGPGPPNSTTSITVKPGDAGGSRRTDRDPRATRSAICHPLAGHTLTASHVQDRTRLTHGVVRQPPLRGLAETRARQANDAHQASRLLPSTHFLPQSSTAGSRTASSAKTKLF